VDDQIAVDPDDAVPAGSEVHHLEKPLPSAQVESAQALELDSEVVVHRLLDAAQQFDLGLNPTGNISAVMADELAKLAQRVDEAT
jgi:hypothetical protein